MTDIISANTSNETKTFVAGAVLFYSAVTHVGHFTNKNLIALCYSHFIIDSSNVLHTATAVLCHCTISMISSYVFFASVQLLSHCTLKLFFR